MTHTLVLLRHGESEWNARNLFTGWVEVPLSERGRVEARRVGTQLRDAKLLPDVVHTSLLRRAISTADIALDVADRHWIPVRRTWRLNERHYGALQGMDRRATLAEFGEEQFMLWRRSFDVRPPELEEAAKDRQDADPRYARLGILVPSTESLKDVVERLVPHWNGSVLPDLRSGKTVLIVGHSNSLRAIVKHLEGINDADITTLNIPTALPLVYRLDDNLTPAVAGGEYLDPDAARAAAQAVADQGR